jgi:ATP:ADP antiporter, AAA family
MKDRLFQLLGVETGEESMVSMLLTQSVFLGIFFGAFDISAHSLFLSVYDEKMMARAYVISGLAGIMLTGTYTWLQARMHFRSFATTNLFFVTLLTFILWVALLLVPGKIVTFAVFVMLGPLNILAMLGFWGTTGRLFTLRQGKRLFGLIDAGLVIGIIISCYAIPVLLSLKFSSHNILIISTASVLAAAIVQVLIGRKFKFVVVEGAKAEKKPGLSIFRENAYIRIMGIFIALSVMTAFFVQYSFMAVTRLQYPLEEDMARFLGLFTGSMMIFTLLVKLLVFSYIIKNYGLRICLAISPILVVAFTALAVIIGMTMGYTPASASGFLVFFLVLALSRLFSKSLKDSIESPSFKVIYQTVDEKIRYEVQSGIDGTVNEISALSSGLILAGLGALSFIKLIHFSWVLLFIIVTWIFVAFRLYQEYRKSIRESLEAGGLSRQSSGATYGFDALKSRASGQAIFSNNYYRMAGGDLSIVENTGNVWFFRKITDHTETYQDLSMLPVLKKIASSHHIDEAVRHRAAEVMDQLAETGGDPRRLEKPTTVTPDDEKLINARKTLAYTRMPQTTEILRLLRDNNIESKRFAIYLIGKFNLDDMIPEVCDCLRVRGLETDAVLVLESFGRKAYEPLFRSYLGSSGNTGISKSIIRLIGRSCEKENTDFLFARLWSNSRILKETAASLLVKCGYKADNDEKDKLHQLITEIIGMMTWNISAQACLSKSDNTLLKGIMDRETASWNNFLYNILSVAYDKGSLDKIRANIESGTVGSVNYALEMIDIVIEDAIKPRLVSLIDVVPDEEKLKNLQQFYPGEIPQYDRLLDDVLNRDYNLISIWAKACALHTMQIIPDKDLEESVTALLFSPGAILREEAARLIGRSDSKLFEAVSGRIPGENLPLLKMIVEGSQAERNFLFEKTNLLSSFFKEISEDELLFLAEHMKDAEDLMAVRSGGGKEYFFWYGNETDTGMKMMILNGENLSAAGEIIKNDHGSHYLLDLDVLEEFSCLTPDGSFEIFKQIDKLQNESI